MWEKCSAQDAIQGRSVYTVEVAAAARAGWFPVIGRGQEAIADAE